MTFMGRKGEYFQRLSETLDITSMGLGDMFEGGSADTF